MPIDDSLRALVDLRAKTLQKSRIAFGNRLDAIQRGVDTASPEAQQLLVQWFDRFDQLEEQAERDIATLIKDDPIVLQLTALKGIGYNLAGQIVSMIDIERADTVSSLWRYSGYGVTNGKRDRPTAGEKLVYNNRLKVSLYNVGTSFLKCRSPYRDIYDNSKSRYEQTRAIPGDHGEAWTKAHIHAASMRRMVKLFLSHLYTQWRTLEGLEVRPAYVHEQLEHTTIYTAQEFGWPAAVRKATLDK